MLRITSGIHRGRQLKTIPGLSTRPTVERLRQAWLNSLQMRLPETRILDLFSGSGALGLEAISRGAAYVVFVEENPKAAQVIRDNIKLLKLEDQCEVHQRKVEQILNSIKDEPPFDFIFMDPPYEMGYEEKILSTWPWESLLAADGRLCIESAARKEGGFAPPAALKIVRDEKYGGSQLTFYDRAREAKDA